MVALPVGTVMSLTGEYEPSTSSWVREQVEAYERSDGREANTLRDTGLPIIVLTTRGAHSGKLRKSALMKVTHAGEYALVASKGGAPDHPAWYRNLVADPTAVMIQDGPEPWDAIARKVQGEERRWWWDLAVRAYLPYAEYQERTDRIIPVLIARTASTEPSFSVRATPRIS